MMRRWNTSSKSEAGTMQFGLNKEVVVVVAIVVVVVIVIAMIV